MDKCIEYSPHVITDAKYSISYNFEYLNPPPSEARNDKGEIYFGPKVMLDSKYPAELLFHPLTTQLMRTKWKCEGLTFFYLAAFIYFVYLVVLSHYIACRHHINVALKGNVRPWFKQVCGDNVLYSQEIILVVMSIVSLLHEFHQMYRERWRYIGLTNAVQLATFIITLIVIGIPEHGRTTIEHSELDLASVCVLLSYVNMLLYIQCLFEAGIYVTMLLEVMRTFLKVIFLFSTLVFAFGLVFMLLLSEEKAFESLHMSLMKVLVMMIGEIEYAHYYVDTKETRRPLVFVAFLTFCIFMPIVLMNLLIGLAVGDIESIQKNAQVKRLANQVQVVYDFEANVPTMLTTWLYRPRVQTFPNQPAVTSCQKILCCLGFLNVHQKFFNEDDNVRQDLKDLKASLKQQSERLTDVRTQLGLQKQAIDDLLLALKALKPGEVGYTEEQSVEICR